MFSTRNVKKMTGDWFYDQRFNRFSTVPGHGLVTLSLKQRIQRKWRKRKLVSALTKNANSCEINTTQSSSAVFRSAVVYDGLLFSWYFFFCSAAKKRETAGELLLKTNDVNPVPPAPLPRTKPKNQISNKTCVFPL